VSRIFASLITKNCIKYTSLGPGWLNELGRWI